MKQHSWYCRLCATHNSTAVARCPRCTMPASYRGDDRHPPEGWEICYVVGRTLAAIDPTYEFLAYHAEVYTAHGMYVTHRSVPFVTEAWLDEYYAPPRMTDEDRRIYLGLRQVILVEGWHETLCNDGSPSNKHWRRVSPSEPRMAWDCQFCGTRNGGSAEACQRCSTGWNQGIETALGAGLERCVVVARTVQPIDDQHELRQLEAMIFAKNGHTVAYHSLPFLHTHLALPQTIPPLIEEAGPRYEEMRTMLHRDGWHEVLTAAGPALNVFWRPSVV